MSGTHGDTDVWAQQASDAAELVGTDPVHRRQVWPYLLVAVVVLAVAAAAVYVVALRADGGVPHPDRWDQRVQQYVDIVEDERDLDFKHPVYVDFLEDAEFAKQVTGDEDDLTDEDRKDIDQATGLFRALGLIEGDVDLFAQVNDLNGAGIIGYYSYDDERIRIRGTEVTPAVESTLVHELTHALQDQHFDLEAMRQRADGDSSASSALDALIEGDARRIETEWRDGLDPADRKALDKDEKKQASGVDEDIADVPEVLTTLMAAPYTFGEAMLAVAVEENGDDAVDDLFRRPPTTDEHELDPWTLIVDHSVPIQVNTPGLRSGEKDFDDGPFGAISWLLVLAERIPVEDALTAADGWGGDAYIAYEKGDTACMRVAYAGDTPADLTEMEQALHRWVDAGPRGVASVTRDGATVEFESCDPGPKAKHVATGDSPKAVAMALQRTYLSAVLAKSGADTEMARCSADLLVRRFTTKQLNDPKLDPVLVARTVAPCRAGEAS